MAFNLEKYAEDVNDITWDVYYEYMQRFWKGEAEPQLSRALQSDLKDYFLDHSSLPYAWLGILLGVSESAQDTTAVYSQIVSLLSSSEFSEMSDRSAMLRIVEKAKIQRKRPKGKALERNQAVFDCGDCLILKFDDGSYGAALVTGRQESGPGECFNLIAPLKFRKSRKPTLDDFKRKQFLRFPKVGIYVNSNPPPYATVWYNADHFEKEYSEKIELLGVIEVTASDFWPTNKFASNWGFLWHTVEQSLPAFL